MLPQVPHQPVDEGFVRVYELRGKDWFDRGTGIIYIRLSDTETEFEHFRLVVNGGDSNNLLLDTEIQREKGFEQQQETLIVWQEPESGLDIVLSFHEAEARARIWQSMENVLNGALEEKIKNLREPRAKVLEEMLEGPLTGDLPDNFKNQDPPKPLNLHFCTEPDCDQPAVGFSSKQALQHHIDEDHIKPRADPVRFVRVNLAEALGLNPDGTVRKEQKLAEGEQVMSLSTSQQGQASANAVGTPMLVNGPPPPRDLREPPPGRSYNPSVYDRGPPPIQSQMHRYPSPDPRGMRYWDARDHGDRGDPRNQRDTDMKRQDPTSLWAQAGTSPSREQVPSTKAWEQYKLTVRFLYVEERKPLKDVMKIMSEKYGFQATPNMYKTWFSQWGFVKNDTEEEVSQLFSAKFQRNVEDSATSKAQGVKAAIKTDAAVKVGNESGELLLSFDSDDGLDTKGGFGFPQKAESMEKDEHPLKSKSSIPSPMRPREESQFHKPVMASLGHADSQKSSAASTTRAINGQILPPMAQQLREAFTSATDSGYASLPTHDYKGPVQNTEVNGNRHFHSDGSEINCTNSLDNEDNYMDDIGSVYTTGPRIPPSKKDAYISSLADDLLNKALIEEPDEESLDRICKALPRHLKTFAMKIGSSDSALICREIMVFVSRYRKEIVNSAREKYINENSIRSDVLGNPTAGMDVGDLISKWSLDLNLSQDPNTIASKKPDDIMDDSHYDNLDEIDQATDSLPELSAYRDFISKHPAYEWLLQSIQKELYMDTPGDIQTNIRDTILGHLPRAQSSISRREPPKIYILTFTADWDPVLFLQGQEYRESLERAAERAITITGSKIDAQAVTTTQYLQQTWPSSGVHLLHVVKHVVCDDGNMPFSYNLPDKTQLIAWSQGSEFKLEVTGTAESIADIGEQLAWIGSALRSSPQENGVTTVGAFVSNMETRSTSKMTEGHASAFFCNIGFNVDVTDDAGEISNGKCWHQLFRSPVIVKGYPIPRRPISNTGLEVGLDILASLTGACSISTFDKKLFVKGFSTLLVPTRYYDNILLWHLICKKNGDRVSYLNGKEIPVVDVSLSNLKRSRHILGWSSQVRYLVGSANASYNINRCWLRGLHENCKLDGILISKDQPIKPNHEAAIGKRETPPWISRKPYRKRLGLLSQKYMVLWDVGCKRGWLVNGVNALLHLLRASIEINKADHAPSEFKFKAELFKEAKTPYTVSAAMEVLTNTANLDMELYEEDERDESGAKIKYRVRDRINDLFEDLEKAIDYQQMMAGARGEKLKSAPRKDLEGWDFKDIAANEDPIYPRLAKLKTVGKGWVDFARAIGAIFLFGRDFGNLIDPVAENSTCSHWEALPANKYYLAASVKDLNTVMDRMGNPRANPPRLTDSLAWHPFNMALHMRCNCSTLTKTYCERAQAIWPLRLSQPTPKSIPLSLEDNGAVVFGHSASVGWIWNDFGDPEKGQLPPVDEESDDDHSADSGIGLSLRSSTIPESQHVGQGIHPCGHGHYKIAIICALPEELMAVRALFDENHQDLPQHESDANTYALGRLGTHCVVAACLPSGDYGTNAASRVASDIEKSFPTVKWYFVVGIGGGIPSEEHDIRLGDVVVSTGVIQHDMGKVTQKGSKIKSTGFPQRPARSLLTAISSVQSDPSLTHDALEAHIQHIVSVRPEYQSPGEDCDKLFPVNSKHMYKQKTCENCKGPHVAKNPRPPGPHIHYGLIASGNQVIKDAVTRNRIGADMNALCFEMEGAGVMATGNCLVIRGICDYADSHKNDEWHRYAAATAAAYTKLFLLRIPNLDMQNREVVQTRKRSASSIEDDGFHPSKRARYH